MHQEFDLKKMSDIISGMKQSADELKEIGPDFPALDRNLVRIRASLKMLEINICDAIESNNQCE
ncbi:MAG: hypothetical protein QG578_1911 [Thermodesulfobacteriota bacterium]|nr:hypothetical protein [Thermodesulfobacteriota bacterium]